MNATLTRPETRPLTSETLRRAQAGDPAAQMELLEPHWDALTRLAHRVTGRADEAEDLAQEVCLRAIQKLSAFRGECAFKTWLYRVALTVCLSAARKPRPQTLQMDSVPLVDPSPSPELLILHQALNERIRQELIRLPARHREVVLLRVVDDLSYAEVAEILRISVGTAQIRYHRGMKQLRTRLAPWTEREERP